MIHRFTAALAALALATGAAAQPAPSPGRAPAPRIAFTPPPSVVPKGNWPQSKVQMIKVHGPSLEGNLEGNAVNRDVIVVLPASYAKSKARRYPVIYFMHGFALTAKGFSDYIHAPEAAAHWASKGAEFIVVLPDTDTKQGGSMYSNSPTTGDFESFIAKDLVGYIDAHYRTIANRSGRGLAGHSMGGYGVWKIGMKYPRVWSSLYAMSACCVSPRTETVDAAKKLSEVPIESVGSADFGTRAGLASVVAWSPNPKNPPYFADFAYKDGKIDPEVIARFAANSPLAMVPQYVPALKSMTAIGMEVGDKDFLLGDDTAIHDALNRFGVAHDWAVYPGGHADKIGARWDQAVLPFFAKHLAKK